MDLLGRADIPKVPQTLLLADDSVTIQRVIELTFADEDIDVVAVSDGDQAIARLDSFPPDIILVDVGMPGKSGYEVAAYVKRSPRLSHIPVVLLTGAFEPVDEERAAGAGCDGVLAKPFEPQLVIGRVKELLGGRTAQPPALREGVFAAPPAAAVVEVSDEGSRSIDDYFDQLDAAFSNLSGKPAQPAGPAPAPGIDWFGLKHASPASTAEPEPELEYDAAPEPVWARVAAKEEEEAEAGATFAAPATEPPPAAAIATDLPPIADAFAALLEAEQGELAPLAAPAWPAAAASAPVAVTDDLVAQVSARVLAQLTDRVVRETVAEIAERLIREEIERIKASIE